MRRTFKDECPFSMNKFINSVRSRKAVRKMIEHKLRSRDAIDTGRNQIKGMMEKERRHRDIVWGSHFEYLLRESMRRTEAI